jgi:sugar/nucleoside kinase (ribokinase family)
MFGITKNVPLVTCIGSITLDLFFPTDEGVIIETPEDILSQKKIAFELGGKINAPEFYDAVGGVAANVAQGLTLLGVPSRCYGALGKDANGKFCREALIGNGVDMSIVHTFSDSRTDLSAVIVSLPGGERTIIHNRDSNKRLVVDSSKLTTPWVFVSSLNGGWQKNIDTVLESQKEKGFRLAVNPGQHNLKEDPALILRLIGKSDVLVLNKDEALELVLYKNPEAKPALLEDESFLLQSLLSTGVTVVAMTDGVRGAWCADKESSWFVNTPPVVQVVETTGAGDAFTSGFLAAFIQDKNLDQAIRYGMANSQAVIKYYGGAEGLIHEKDIEKAILHIIPQKIS